MPFSFNAVACMLPILSAAELEVAGVLIARVVKNAIRCPSCGVHYSLIVPASASGLEREAAAEELLAQVRCTCGDHPPIIQKR
jgi:hypothetical protein